MTMAQWSIPAALILIGSFAHAVEAGAINPQVKSACRADYFRYCSAYRVGSEALRQCMDRMGNRLSGPCVQALVDAGQISPDELARRAERLNNR